MLPMSVMSSAEQEEDMLMLVYKAMEDDEDGRAGTVSLLLIPNNDYSRGVRSQGQEFVIVFSLLKGERSLVRW